MRQQERVIGVKGPDHIVVRNGLGVEHREPAGACPAAARQHERQPRGRGAGRSEQPGQPLRPEFFALLAIDHRLVHQFERDHFRVLPGQRAGHGAHRLDIAVEHRRVVHDLAHADGAIPPAGMRCRSTTTLSPAMLISRADRTTSSNSSSRSGAAFSERNGGIDRHAHEVEAVLLQPFETGLVERPPPFREGQHHGRIVPALLVGPSRPQVEVDAALHRKGCGLSRQAAPREARRAWPAKS